MRTFRPNKHWGRSRYQFAVENLIGPRILSIGNIGDQGAWQALLKVYENSKTEVWGLDVNLEKAITLQKPHFTRQVLGDAQALPFGEHSFSAIWMGQILEHLYEPLNTLRYVYQALVPGGVLVLDTPNVYALGRMIRWIFKGEDNMLGDPTHVIFYSFTSVYVLLENAGFQCIQLSSDGKVSFGFATSRIRLKTVPRVLRFLERFGSHVLALAWKPGSFTPSIPDVQFVCPITRKPLTRINDRLYTPDQSIAYPIQNDIPCLRPVDINHLTAKR